MYIDDTKSQGKSQGDGDRGIRTKGLTILARILAASIRRHSGNLPNAADRLVNPPESNTSEFGANYRLGDDQ